VITEAQSYNSNPYHQCRAYDIVYQYSLTAKKEQYLMLIRLIAEIKPHCLLLDAKLFLKMHTLLICLQLLSVLPMAKTRGELLCFFLFSDEFCSDVLSQKSTKTPRKNSYRYRYTKSCKNIECINRENGKGSNVHACPIIV
jgi:hypothetical protein